MVRLIIDSCDCDLHEGFSPPQNIFTYDSADLSSPNRWRQGRRVELEIPSTPRNDAIMCFAVDIHAAERFNSSHHEGVVEIDGQEMLRGVVCLEQVKALPISEQGNICAVSYKISLTSGAPTWARYIAITPLRQTAVDYSATMNGAAIIDSWAEECPVKYLPVVQDKYLMPENQSSLYMPQRVLTTGDYYPFVSVEALLKKIFSSSGFTLRSDFMESELFKSLYMSGCLEAGNANSSSHLNSTMGFYAGRRSEVEAAADFFGRVYASPLVLASSLGNIVETADVADNEEFFVNGDTLSISDEGVIYTPKTAATVAFDLHLKYTTDYRILSRERLQGFDSIYVDSGCDMQFGLLNPFEDRRHIVRRDTNYLCMIFDFVEGEEYRLEWVYNTGAKGYRTITARATSVTSVSSSYLSHCQLVKKNAEGVFEVYEGDWALYDGHVTETGEREVEITLKTTPEALSPQNPKYFTRMYLYGATEGQLIRLSKECTLRPVFTSAIGFGSEVKMKDLLQHNCSQMDLLAAVQQMFNLRIFSSKERKEVWIEPRDDFYTDKVVDWSHRVLLSEPVTTSDIAAEVSAKQVLAYRSEGGGQVERFNKQADTELGEFSTKTESYIALDDVSRNENGLFCPTLSITEVYDDAPSAALLSIGNRDADEVEDKAIRIVRYMGLQPLPVGQLWGFPLNGDEYPFAAFHYPFEMCESDGAAIRGEEYAAGPESSFTLCFEERDGVTGLHTYYDRQRLMESQRRVLSLSIRIAPHELMSLGEFDGDNADFRSLFCFNLFGEPSMCRLRSVDGYDAERGVAKMIFTEER